MIALVAAVALAAFIETRDSSHNARKPLTPPRTTRPASRSTIESLSAARLNNEGYAKMRRGDFAGALPLLQLAVRRLHGSGSVDEAYADFNLANTRYHLGKCTNVLALLEHSQQIQGRRAAIDNLRSAAQKTCA